MRRPRFPTSDFGAAQCISNRKAKLVLTYSRQTPSNQRCNLVKTRKPVVSMDFRMRRVLWANVYVLFASGSRAKGI